MNKKPIVDYGGKQSEILSSDTIPISNLGSGVPNGTKFLRDDGVFTTPTNNGISRVISILTGASVSAGSTLSTDYIYICTGNCTITLPTAVGNTNMYTIKNTTGNETINTTSLQTIDGSTSIQLLVENQSVDLISNGSNWLII